MSSIERFRDRLSGRRVLVTGARGMIGSALCRALTTLGANVTGSGRGESSPLNPAIGQWLKADLTRQDETEALFARVRPELVFNLAGFVCGDRAINVVNGTLAGNLVSTVNLLTAAHAAGVLRFVNTGSLQEPMDAQEAPCSPYAASKWAANAYARMFESLFDLDVVIVRLFMVYGPGQIDGSKLIPYVTRRFLKGEAPMLTSGTYEADWVYVDDIARGLIAAASVPEARGATFELGTGQLTCVRSIVYTIKHIVGSDIEPSFGAKPDRPREMVRSADIRSAEEVLSWRPEIDLGKGLPKTVSWFRENEA